MGTANAARPVRVRRMAHWMDGDHPYYRWIAPSNTTLGMLMAMINSSIVIISLPAIFRGISLDPLAPSNVSYLLWMLMGFLVVTAVLVVSLGRLGDIYGRVRIYTLGFVVFTGASVALTLDPLSQGGGALWLILWRLVQGVGAAMLFANSTAILTDAFPAEQRGMALGINQVAAIAGSFIGLLAGGLLSEWHWRAILCVGAVRPARDGVVDAQPARARRAGGRPHRRLGQPALRSRLDRCPHGDHLRHPAVRGLGHGLAEPVGARRADRWGRSARRVLLGRDPGARPDVRDALVPHPGFQRRQPGRLARLGGPRRP